MQPAATGKVFHKTVSRFEAISKVKAAGGAVSINIGTLDALWRLGQNGHRRINVEEPN